MDFDEIAEASHEASCDAWFDLYNSLQMGYNGCYAFQCLERLCTSKTKSDVNSVRKSTCLETNIRTPKLIAYGMEDDLGLGPFVITEFIKGRTLDKLWKENPKESRSGLRSDIDEKVQEIVYRQVANILLELAEHKFDRIGSLSFDDGGSYSVTARPLTLKMNEVARVGGVVNDGRLFKFPLPVSKHFLHH
jgi:hypothetical protein